MWIWVLSASGGSATAVADQAERYGIEVVFVKSGDGDDYWTPVHSKPFVNALHARGLDVCAWQFVYGSDPRGEASRCGRGQAGADCFVIEPRTSTRAATPRPRPTCERLRGRRPRLSVALTPLPLRRLPPDLPVLGVPGPRAAQYNLPQMYWHTIGVSVASNFDHTYRFNRPYGQPDLPARSDLRRPAPKDEVIEFRRHARA